ncbi:MAG: hypothetical protein WC285_03115 [Candidatus Gracilibacteria bacterium]
MENAQKLHHEFLRLGGMRHKLKNRMLAILPEIYKSGIYKKYAGSIVEYAGKFGDIAKTTVMKRLRLEKNLEDKPFLKAVIEKVGVHKVALVAKIATSETDKIFAEKVENMSRVAVQSLSKELRAGEAGLCNGNRGESSDGGWNGGDLGHDRFMKNGCGQLNFEGYVSGESLEQTNFDSNHSQLCRAVPRTAKIELDEESTFLLMKLKAKLGKHLSDQEFLKLVLKERVEQEFPVVVKQNGARKPEKSEKEIGKKVSSQNAVKLKMALCREKVAKENVTGDTFEQEAKQSNKSFHSQSGGESFSRTRESVSENNEIPVFPPGGRTGTGMTETGNSQEITRYIRAFKKRETIAQTNGKCSYPNCNFPFQILHHVDRFSESRSHDSVIPLCKIHHEFAHNNLIKNENLNTKRWGLVVAGQGAELGAGLVGGSVAGPVAELGAELVAGSIAGPMTDSVSTQPSQISQAEILYRKYRQKALAGSFGG